MPSYKDRLIAQQKKLSERERMLEKYAKDIVTAQENIKKAHKDISDIKAEIDNIKLRLLADMIAEKGITVGALSAAIEAGAFSNIVGKPPDNIEKAIDEKNAENGTTAKTILSEKEELTSEET